MKSECQTNSNACVPLPIGIMYRSLTRTLSIHTGAVNARQDARVDVN